MTRLENRINAQPCAVCTLPLGKKRDRTPVGIAHAYCARVYRTQRAGKTDRDTQLPKHLR